VEYQELAGKAHWWWDTDAANDGGSVNDPQLRSFYQRAHQHTRKGVQGATGDGSEAHARQQPKKGGGKIGKFNAASGAGNLLPDLTQRHPDSHSYIYANLLIQVPMMLQQGLSW
jgi:hypothetical protein